MYNKNMIREIVQNPHPALRAISEEIAPENINSDEIQNIVQDMKDSLATQKDGVALAAPQIGITKRIFVVAPFIFEEPEHENLVFINPKITFNSKKSKWKHEGCLSCRWTVGEVDRSLETTVVAYNEKGEEFTRVADGLLAHIFQHETDHLNGTLFIDKARKMREMTDEEVAEIENS